MSQKSKLCVEEKAEIIRKYQQGEISLSQAARYAEVGLTTIYRWSARYEAEGVTGLLPYQKNRVYPPELKLKAVQEYLSGVGSLGEISKKYKLRNDRQLSNWIKIYRMLQKIIFLVDDRVFTAQQKQAIIVIQAADLIRHGKFPPGSLDAFAGRTVRAAADALAFGAFRLFA